MYYLFSLHLNAIDFVKTITNHNMFLLLDTIKYFVLSYYGIFPHNLATKEIFSK